MSAANDRGVLDVIGTCRLETSQFASKWGVSRAVALRVLRQAESAGVVESHLATDGVYFRRGAARPLIWRATDAALASAGGAK